MAGETAPGNDLLIVGPGMLGCYAGKLWLESHPGSTVVAQTATENNHERLKKMGLQPSLKPADNPSRFDNILFSAPPVPGPSVKDDYVGEVKAALDRWTGKGCFVFTSSNSIVELNEETGFADEDAPRIPLGQEGMFYNDAIILSEDAVKEAGGVIIRYAGLYHSGRGAHNFFLKKAEVDRWGGFILNFIHYEDAASLAVAVLSGHGDAPFNGRVFVGFDGNSVTMQEMMDATVASGKYEGNCKFTGEQISSKPLKPNANPKTRAAVCWEPKYSSFISFMQGGAQDFYNTSGLF